MYYKVEILSETGKRLSAVHNSMVDCYQAARKVAIEHGFKQWFRYQNTVAGGIAGFYYEENIEPKVWKRVSKNYYAPKKSSKEGREILKEINALPSVSFSDLNNAVGLKWDCAIWAVVGLDTRNPDYFGVITDADWKLTLSSDCIEITSKEYYKLFKIAE